MQSYGRSQHADCRYWGLTWWQCMRYHARLANYHARRAARHAERARRMSRCVELLAGAVVGLFLVSLLAHLLGGRW